MGNKHYFSFAAVVFCIYLLAVPTFAATNSPPFIDFSIGGDGIEVTIGDNAAMDSESAYADLFRNYKAVAQVITGICIITSLILFLYQIMKLGAAGDSQRERKSAITGILVCGLVLAAFGGLEVIVSVFWHTV